ncbi:MAG: hypothetical protein ACJ8F7_18615, partial [Gemmataceae bacterium]
MNSLILTLASLTVAAPPAPPPGPPVPVVGGSPLVYIKVLGPVGMRVTFFPGTPAAKTYVTPAEVGVRPGYVYRVQLDGVPGLPAPLYPSFEVRGLLQMTVPQAARHPIPIVFIDEEMRRVFAVGSLITKAYFLEDPTLAPPLQTTPDEPLVFEVPAETDPAQEARNRGRLMVVVRLGEREPDAQELVRMAVPNTILFAGEPRLALPPVPPYIPWLHWPVYDPLLGAKRSAEECLPDGGDVGPRLGIGPDGKLGNLNASDTAIEYTTEAGNRRVATSNRVCVLVPRFAAARQEVVPAGISSGLAAGLTKSTKGNFELNNRLRSTGGTAITTVAATTGRKIPSGIQGRLLLHGYDNIKGVNVVGMIEGLKVVGQVKEPDEITAYPFCEPISLFKWAEPKEAQVGDVVTFFLRYHNHTRQPVENLVISDSLTARLEYVPG